MALFQPMSGKKRRDNGNHDINGTIVDRRKIRHGLDEIRKQTHHDTGDRAADQCNKYRSDGIQIKWKSQFSAERGKTQVNQYAGQAHYKETKCMPRRPLSLLPFL